jgi:hypothetical protein
MDVNQKYCQSCYLISHYENNELTDMLLIQSVPKKEDESITPLLIGRF